MSLFNNLPEIVDSHLHITDEWVGIKPRYKSPTSLLRMTDENLPNGCQLVRDLFAQMMWNWGVAGCPATGSKENWRSTKNLDFEDKKRGPEVPLERTIARVVSDDWSNQVPVDSGLLGKGGKTLDLAGCDGDSLDLIELKVDSNTPLSAAIQVLSYGLANLFFQVNRHRLFHEEAESRLLDPKDLRLHVLAPVAFYERFEKVSSWLEQFQNRLSEGVRKFSEQFENSEYPRITSFDFQTFPSDFTFDQSRCNDETYLLEVRNAFDHRRQYFL